MQYKGALGFVPARSGSTRLPQKALATINGVTLLEIALRKAIKSGLFSKVICLGDSDAFEDICASVGAEYLSRAAANASNLAKSDDVVNEIIDFLKPETAVWVNLTHPFLSIRTIQRVQSLLEANNSGIDTCMTSHTWQGHATLIESNDSTINFDKHTKFAQTQDISPIRLYTYAAMGWRCKEYSDRYHRNGGSSLLTGNIAYVETSRIESLWIKYPEDLLDAQRIATGYPL